MDVLAWQNLNKRPPNSGRGNILKKTDAAFADKIKPIAA
jgi:hypothetical protein